MHYSDYTGLPVSPPSSPQLESLELPPLNENSKFISYMTDDHTPIEFSWQFEKSGEATVRFAIDPVMRQANPEVHGSIMGLFHELSQTGLLAQNTDFTWSRICMEALTVAPEELSDKNRSSLSYSSQYFIGFDCMSTGIRLKAYFLPEARAALTLQSKQTLIAEMIKRLDSSCQVNLTMPWFNLLHFFDSLPQAIFPEFPFVAVDCLPSRQNRLKIYARTHLVTFSNLRRFLTLDSKGYSGLGMKNRAWEHISLLWYLLFPETFHLGEDAEVPSNNPGNPTGGLSYYYELRDGCPTPSVKVYIPVRNLCPNDEYIVKALETFFRITSNSCIGSQYTESVRDTFTHRPLAARAGIHTYVSLSIKPDDRIEVMSYFNPEFSPDL
ncbi:hypothetical protein M422DRAFT_178429 [Sphaerobolus stellatus SS14]|uniref:Aromatic prenyltransferase n=1 Tax=Sphaerobolus stellatus (strain SS14) TaxID=990650 RepID=A0A0C9U2Y7_SPHS4|nr:hypothetical protein M422DRAFT_178429 [Sphaerobolus stellatus SS14]